MMHQPAREPAPGVRGQMPSDPVEAYKLSKEIKQSASAPRQPRVVAEPESGQSRANAEPMAANELTDIETRMAKVEGHCLDNDSAVEAFNTRLGAIEDWRGSLPAGYGQAPGSYSLARDLLERVSSTVFLITVAAIAIVVMAAARGDVAWGEAVDKLVMLAGIFGGVKAVRTVADQLGKRPAAPTSNTAIVKQD